MQECLQYFPPHFGSLDPKKLRIERTIDSTMSAKQDADLLTLCHAESSSNNSERNCSRLINSPCIIHQKYLLVNENENLGAVWKVIAASITQKFTMHLSEILLSIPLLNFMEPEKPLSPKMLD
ncbi:MAG: hypothetical protein RLY14_2266 [Planctomycetota bacterium]|jgi:hypothetical protein